MKEKLTKEQIEKFRKEVAMSRICTTIGVNEFAKTNPRFVIFIRESISRYFNCDWGDTCETDVKLNNESAVSGEKVLAAYKFFDTDIVIWICTEWDRSVTTILFPDEY